MESFIDIILPAALQSWGRFSLYRNEYQEYFLGIRRAVRRTDKLTTFMCRLSRNLGASTSWNPLLPVQACNGIALPFTPSSKKSVNSLGVLILLCHVVLSKYYYIIRFSQIEKYISCFFLSCKANARVKPAKTGHGPRSS